jgi:hypothetical protein
MEKLQCALLEILYKAYSEECLNAYRRQEDEDNSFLIARYLWNMALSESFYPAFHNLEITLRNTIHEVMTEKYGTNFWFDVVDYRPQEAQKLRQAKEALEKDKKPLEAGRIVAELNLGFWNNLFLAHYEQKLWRGKSLARVFSYMNKSERHHKAIFKKLSRLRTLRNRVFILSRYGKYRI